MASLAMGYTLAPPTVPGAPLGYGPDPIEVLCLPTNLTANKDGTVTPTQYACYYPFALAPADVKKPEVEVENMNFGDGMSPAIAKICDQGLNPFHAILGGKNFEWMEFDRDEFFLERHIPGNPVEAYISTSGVTHIKLRKGFRLSLTINQCIRLDNPISNIQIAVNSGGLMAALTHPLGLVFQNESIIDVKTDDVGQGSKFARISEKGIQFMQSNGGTFFIDESGTKTCRNGRFSDLKNDITIPAFYADSLRGKKYMESAAIMLRASTHFKDYKNVDHWVINGIDISQTKGGTVRCVYGKGNEIELRSSDLCGTASLITPFIRCTASVGSDDPDSRSGDPHLFISQGDRRLHFDGTVMKCRCKNQSARLEPAGELIL